jgi:hypothetical protein
MWKPLRVFPFAVYRNFPVGSMSMKLSGPGTLNGEPVT